MTAHGSSQRNFGIAIVTSLQAGGIVQADTIETAGLLRNVTSGIMTNGGAVGRRSVPKLLHDVRFQMRRKRWHRAGRAQQHPDAEVGKLEDRSCGAHLARLGYGRLQRKGYIEPR
jgi:hypothetical protein